MFSIVRAIWKTTLHFSGLCENYIFLSGALYFAEHHAAQQLLIAVVIRLYQTGSVETLVPVLSHSALIPELLQSTELATVMPAEDDGGDGRQVRTDPSPWRC